MEHSKRINGSSEGRLQIRRASDASAVPTRRSAPSARRTFTVGAADDATERDADATAAIVLDRLRTEALTRSDDQESHVDTPSPRIRRRPTLPARQAASAPTDRRVHRLGHPGSDVGAGDATRIRRATPIGLAGGELDHDTDRQLRSSVANGRPLPKPLRRKMETAFDADFGGVSMHTGTQATELNRRLGAQAFTVGSHVYFRDGMPDVESETGAHLVAHELTHVVQQGAGVSRSTAVIRRTVEITGLGDFEPGSTPDFWKALLKYKNNEQRPEVVEAWVKKVTGLDVFEDDGRGGRRTANDFNVLYSAMTGSDGKFASADEFLKELGLLRKNWGGQKMFYEKPVGTTRKLRSAVQGQQGDIVRLYSAREKDQIRNLFIWAREKGIKMKGEKTLRGIDKARRCPAPFSGHFGDRTHTIKYAGQKGEGAGLICLVLTQSASNLLRTKKATWDQDPDAKGKDGGEGNIGGDFGFKLENSFVSVAIGDATATWNFLQDKIASIEFTLN